MMQRAGTGEYVALARGTAPFEVKATVGVLLDNGLPGQVTEVYHKSNVPIVARRQKTGRLRRDALDPGGVSSFDAAGRRYGLGRAG